MKKVAIDELLDVINTFDKIKITKDQLDDKLPELGMDSILFIQLVVALEEVFDCEFPDSKLLITEMDTVNKILGVLYELHGEQERQTKNA